MPPSLPAYTAPYLLVLLVDTAMPASFGARSLSLCICAKNSIDCECVDFVCDGTCMSVMVVAEPAKSCCV